MRVFILIFNSILWLQGMCQSFPEYSYDKNQVRISIENNQDSSEYELKIFRSVLSSAQISESTPILGNIEKKNSSLIFTPIIPFSKDNEYTIYFNGMSTYFMLEIPEDYIRLNVVGRYPSKEELAANILKMHIQFNKPVSRVRILDHIFITDNTGNKMDRVILDLENAILSDHDRILTIWIEPGRQKRGLQPNEILGPPFVVGGTYHLHVMGSLRDNEGILMEDEWVSSFTISEADRKSPDISMWQLSHPDPGIKEPLILTTDESMDYVSFSQLFSIKNENGEKVAGQINLDNNEQLLIFHPNLPWKKENYTLILDTAIEDPSGNNLIRLFDEENVGLKSENLNSDYKTMTFIIK